MACHRVLVAVIIIIINFHFPNVAQETTIAVSVVSNHIVDNSLNMQNKSSLLPVNETFPAKNEKFLEKIVTALPSTTATLANNTSDISGKETASTQNEPSLSMKTISTTVIYQFSPQQKTTTQTDPILSEYSYFPTITPLKKLPITKLPSQADTSISNQEITITDEKVGTSDYPVSNIQECDQCNTAFSTVGTTPIPIEKIIQDFTAVWRTDAGEYHVLLSWVQESTIMDLIGWEFFIHSNISSTKQSLKIDFNCSSWNGHESRKRGVKLMKDKFVCSDHGRKPSQSYNLTLDPCSSYNLRLKPIYVDEQQTNTFITAELKPIKNEGLVADYVKITNARAVNQTCLLVDWSLKHTPHVLAACNEPFRIRLHSPSGEEQFRNLTSSDRDAGKEMFCHLRPGTEYKVSVVFENEEIPQSLTIKTSSAFDAVTVGLIAVTTLLIVVLVGVAFYAYLRSWFTRHFRSSTKTGESLNYQTSFFSNLSRRRSHPIKIRNLDAVTQRLCSSAGHLLEMEFEDLNIIADARRTQESPHSLVTENTIKNRYVNILPYEHTRVPLSLLPGISNSDYINASYILGFSGSKNYIASQGPKNCTVGDFWRMVWEQNVHIIVMVTGLEERGKAKCDRYWPEDTSLTFDHITICLLNETTFENYILRNLQVQVNGMSRIVKQAFMKEWPDFGVPDCPETLVSFIEVVRILVREAASTPSQNQSNQPILVHCSAGVGRTGTFIAVDWLMQEARVSKTIDIFSTVLRMRECRINMVQSEEQYEYVYRCLAHFVNTRIFSATNAGTNLSDAETLLTNGHNHHFIELDER